MGFKNHLIKVCYLRKMQHLSKWIWLTDKSIKIKKVIYRFLANSTDYPLTDKSIELEKRTYRLYINAAEEEESLLGHLKQQR